MKKLYKHLNYSSYWMKAKIQLEKYIGIYRILCPKKISTKFNTTVITSIAKPLFKLRLFLDCVKGSMPNIHYFFFKINQSSCHVSIFFHNFMPALNYLRPKGWETLGNFGKRCMGHHTMRTSLDGSSPAELSAELVPGSWKRTLDATFASIFWWCWSSIDCTWKICEMGKTAQAIFRAHEKWSRRWRDG